MNAKKDDFKLSIRLDNRRRKKDKKYPVKLKVYSCITQKEKWYSLNIDLTIKEFENIWINAENKNLRGLNKEINLKLKIFETRAHEEAKLLPEFNFEIFERKLFRKLTDRNNVQFHFQQIIDKNLKNNKIGTAESYKYTLKSLAKYSKEVNNCDIEKLTFETITASWLNSYEHYMLSNGKSYTTISIYTRTLRVVFNNAIASNDVNKTLYPFGLKKHNKYKIPKTRKVKKALTSEQLRILFNAEVKNENEAKAKALWFFSYACNGMNFKDIALLKYSNIKDEKFEYNRAKTFDKSSTKTTITVYLTDFTRDVIKKYGTGNKNGYVFDIVGIKEDSQTQYKKIKNFTRYINDHIKRIALAYGLPNELSTYWARHSFATNSLRKGATMEFISEALNHSDLSVTKNYFAGFEDKAKKEFANQLLDF